MLRNKVLTTTIAGIVLATLGLSSMAQAKPLLEDNEFIGYGEGEYGFDITGGKTISGMDTSLLLKDGTLQRALDMRGEYKAIAQKTKAGGENNLWFTALEQAGKEVGYNIGFWKRGSMLQTVAKRTERSLDRIWTFNRLMMAKGRVVPPVISKADDSLLLSDDTINISNVVYIIKKQAYITTNPPSWEDYLLADSFYPVNLSDIDKSTLPITKDDIAVWKRNVLEGFKDGVRDAELTMVFRLKSLREDFIGMTRYHILLEQGMITRPFTTVNNLGITGNNGSEMRVGERIIRLEVKPTLVQNTKQWQGLPEIDDAFGEASRGWIAK